MLIFFLLPMFFLSLSAPMYAKGFASFSEDLKNGHSFTADIGMSAARLWLKMTDDRVEGFYRYEKSLCSLRLVGMRNDLSITLEERDCKDKPSGRFLLK